MTKPRRSGFSLLETLIGVTLLSVGMAAAFFVFNLGTYYFQLGLARQGVQAQGRKAMVWLDHDIRQSCSNGLQNSPLSTPTAPSGLTSRQGRYALCLPGMDDWNNPNNFDGLGNPQFNRYYIYYATQADAGTLYRLEVNPGTSTSQPWSQFLTVSTFLGPNLPGILNPPPAVFTLGGASAVSKSLCDSVLAFGVSNGSIGTTTLVYTSLLLRSQTNGNESGQTRDETLQFNLYSPAYNKLP